MSRASLVTYKIGYCDHHPNWTPTRWGVTMARTFHVGMVQG